MDEKMPSMRLCNILIVSQTIIIIFWFLAGSPIDMIAKCFLLTIVWLIESRKKKYKSYFTYDTQLPIYQKYTNKDSKSNSIAFTENDIGYIFEEKYIHLYIRAAIQLNEYQSHAVLESHSRTAYDSKPINRDRILIKVYLHMYIHKDTARYERVTKYPDPSQKMKKKKLKTNVWI